MVYNSHRKWIKNLFFSNRFWLYCCSCMETCGCFYLRIYLRCYCCATSLNTSWLNRTHLRCNIARPTNCLSVFIQILSKPLISILHLWPFKRLHWILRIDKTRIVCFILICLIEIIFHILVAKGFALFESQVFVDEF